MVAGVPQGSVLGPKLFNIFLADIPIDPLIKILQFADDIIIYITHRAPVASSLVVNRYLDKLNSFYKNWKLNVNGTKTELVNFVGINSVTRKLKKDLKDKQKILFDKNVILPKKSLKYLGVNFTSNFRFNAHIDSLIKKLKSSVALLARLFSSKFIDSRFGINIYKIYIRSQMQYAANVWLNPTYLSSYQIEKLRIVERKIIRRAGKIKRDRDSYTYLSNAKLYDVLRIVRIDRFLINHSVNYFAKCRDSLNDFLMGLIEPFSILNKYWPTSYALSLFDSGMLFDNNGLFTWFNRRKNDLSSIVYSTGQ